VSHLFQGLIKCWKLLVHGLNNRIFEAKMSAFDDFVNGLFSVLKVTSSPMLYRYKYRNSAEGLRKDWLSIGGDIHSVIGKLEENDNGNKRN
jgi:hypothetical protein